MSLQNFNHIGEELRRAIDAIYTKLPITEKPSIALPTVGKDPASVDIATLVQTFIPMGTPFVEAEQMLVSAGFTVDTHEPNPFLEDSDPRKNSVTARIDQQTFNPVAHMRVYVALNPVMPNDLSTVGKLTASLYKQDR